MKNSDGPAWLLRIQNTFLPLAKEIYIFAAIGSLLTIVGGIIFALYLQSVVARPGKTVPVPPLYSESAADLGSAPVSSMDLSLVDSRLAPPANIRFEVTIGTITDPLREEDGLVLGYFVADTANGLASSIDGISLVEGGDAALFERTFDQKQKRIGLKATAVLINEINETLRDIQEQKQRNFTLQVVARDQYKNRSDATSISFPLRFWPKTPPSPTPEPAMSEPTELEKIAGDIAKIVEPEANQARTAAYRRALEIPTQCGAGEQNQVLLAKMGLQNDQVCLDQVAFGLSIKLEQKENRLVRGGF